MKIVQTLIKLNLTFLFITLSRPKFYRLAALEIGRFQDQLIRKLTDEMNAQQHQEGNGPATGAVIVPYYQMQEHEWTLARAFLYSLTVLTTIGKSFSKSSMIHFRNSFVGLRRSDLPRLLKI